jgi:hypothetical protein
MSAPEQVEIDTMSEAQIDEMLAQALAPQADSQVQPDPEPDSAGVAAAEPAQEQGVVGGGESGAQAAPAESAEPPVETIDWKARYDEAEQKRKSYDGRINATARELEEARARLSEYEARMAQYQRVDAMLQDPKYASMFLQQGAGVPGNQPQYDPNFDYTNPEAIQQHVARTVQQQLLLAEQQRQARETANQRLSFNAAVRAAKIKLAAERQVDPTVIDGWEGKLQQDMVAGRIAEIAERWANHDALIAEAEKRGADRERERISKLKDQPRRTATTHSGTPPTPTGVDINKLDPLSREFDDELGKIIAGMKRSAP